jgi:thioredoxin-related protein
MHKCFSLLLLTVVVSTAACGQPATTPPDTVQAATTAAPQGPAWKTFEEAVTAAQANGKKVLIDIYAPWCGWCRKMQAEVYTLPAVLTYLDEHFEIGRVNIDEEGDTLQFRGYTLSSAMLARGLGASATPTTVFLEPEGEYITRLPGYVKSEDFMNVLKFIGSGAYRTQSYQDFTGQQ